MIHGICMYVYIYIHSSNPTFRETATKFSLEFRVYSARIKLWTVIFHAVETQGQIFTFDQFREKSGRRILQGISTLCVPSSTVKRKLGRGKFFTCNPLCRSARSGERERESRESGNCFWPTLFARWKRKDIVGLR